MIFGTDPPKLVYDLGGAGETTLLLDYIVRLSDGPVPDYSPFKSVINGHSEKRLKGKHWQVEYRMHLYKYHTGGDAGLTAALSKYNEIKDFEGLPCALYRYREQALPMQSNIDFVFNVSGVSVSPTVGAIYSNNSCNYKVIAVSLAGGDGTITLHKITLNILRPETSGTLTKVSGTGDATITFTSRDGSIVLFDLEVTETAFWETTDFKDLLILNLTSRDYVDCANDVTRVIQTTEIIMNNGVI